MTYIDQVDDYLAKIAQLWPDLTSAEQQAFHDWKDAHPSMRNSDWPGWIRYIGARPARAEIITLQKAI